MDPKFPARTGLTLRSVGRGVSLFLGVLVLSGCSVKMAYNNLDRLVRWGVSDYVDFNAEQRALFNREFAEVHRWHRLNHLPEYAQFARDFANTASDGVSAARVEAVMEQFLVWFEDVEAQATPMVIGLIQTLSDEQLAKLPERLEASNLELAEPELDKSLAEVQALWVEEFTDAMKNFTGRLNQAQRTYLEKRSLEYRPERVLWADYRRRFQADLMQVLARRHEGEAFAASYRALIEQRESYYGPELDAVFKHNQVLNQQAAAYILSNLTERQSERFVERLRDLGDDLEALSKQT